MIGPTKRIATIAAPYGREIRLIEVTFENGSRFLRMTIREGTRFTILDLDATTAQLWAQALTDWATIQEHANGEAGSDRLSLTFPDGEHANPPASTPDRHPH